MKKVSKVLSLLTASILVIGTLSACGSGNQASSAASQGTAQSSAGEKSTPSSDDVIQFKMGMTDPENSNYVQGAKKIAEEVKVATNGRIEITVYPSGQLGNDRDAYEGAQLGTVDICTPANAVMASFIPEMAVLDQPFLFENADQAHRAIDGKLGELIAQKAEQQGLHIVGWMESGFRNVFSSRPVQTMDDFKGLKIRTMENDMHMAAFNALGAIATPMAYGDVFTGLQQKTIDAAENATANVLASNFYEVTKNVTHTNHLFVFITVALSDKAWNQIPDDLKPVFVEAVKKGCDYQRQLLVEANESAEKELKEKGVSFYDVDLPALQAAVIPAMEQFKDRMPQEWLDAIEEAKKG